MTNRQLRYRMNHYYVTVKDDDQSASQIVSNFAFRTKQKFANIVILIGGTIDQQNDYFDYDGIGDLGPTLKLDTTPKTDQSGIGNKKCCQLLFCLLVPLLFFIDDVTMMSL